MDHTVTRTADSVELEHDGRRLAIGWSRNRFHYHRRVLRLAFIGFDGVPGNVVKELVDAMLSEAFAATADLQPLLLRVTLEDEKLLAALQELGFLLARGVYVVSIEVSDLLRSPKVEVLTPLRLTSLQEATALVSEDELTAVWTDAYGRAARLDPATLEELTGDERRALLLGDEELNADLSVCAFLDERLVGVCPVYGGSGELERELGAVGVAAPWLERHSEISLAMLRDVADRAAGAGVSRILAEVDADAPSSVYIFADLPGRVVESLVSLMYVPKWVSGPRSET